MFKIICFECQYCNYRNYINTEKFNTPYTFKPMLCLLCNKDLDPLYTTVQWKTDNYRNARFLDINEIYVELL